MSGSDGNQPYPPNSFDGQVMNVLPIQPLAFTGLADRAALASGPVVIDVENFEAMTNSEMKTRVTSFTPEMASEFSTAWQQFGKSISAATEALQADTNSADSNNFDGHLPDKVREKSKAFIHNSDRFSNLTSTPSEKLDGFGGTLSSVQNQFPLLSMYGSESPQLLNPGGLLAPSANLEKPSPLAIFLMESTYSPAVLDAGNGLPTLPGPIAFGASGGAGGGPGSPTGGGGFPSGADVGSPQGMAGGPGAGAAGGAATAGGEGSSGQLADPTSPEAGPGAGAAGGSPMGGGSANDTAISQAGLAPSADGTQATGVGGQSGRGGVVAGPGGPGGGAVPMASPIGGGSAGGSAGGRGGGAGGSGSGIGGRPSGSPAPGSLGGSPAAAGKGGLPRGPGMGAAGEGGANNAMSGRRGMGGGMMGGAGRGRGQEDDAYSPAEFLTTIDNGDKLIGPLPRVVHPVIGAWADR